jgi:hypothetical protein
VKRKRSTGRYSLVDWDAVDEEVERRINEHHALQIIDYIKIVTPPSHWSKEQVAELRKEVGKLKERDRRPKHQFEPGDLVEFHGSVKESQGGRGLVLETAPHSKGDGFQTCTVAFGGRDDDLFRQARRYISHMQAQSSISFGAEVINTKLVYKGKAPREWLKSISAKEVRSIRFMKILDDEDY